MNVLALNMQLAASARRPGLRTRIGPRDPPRRLPAQLARLVGNRDRRDCSDTWIHRRTRSLRALGGDRRHRDLATLTARASGFAVEGRSKQQVSQAPEAGTPMPHPCCGCLHSCPPSASPSALLRCSDESRSETVDPDRYQPVAPHAVRSERDVEDRRAPGGAARREDEVAERPRDQRVLRRRRDTAEHVRVRTDDDLRPRVQAGRRELLLPRVRRRVELRAPIEEGTTATSARRSAAWTSAVIAATSAFAVPGDALVALNP